MCDEDLLSLQNILQSVPRRELKIILQTAEYIFPALKNSLVRVLVCEHRGKKAVNVYFQKIIFGNILPPNLYFSLFVQLNWLRFYSGIYFVLSILHSCCIGSNEYIVEKCMYTVYTGNIYTTGMCVH